MNRTDRLLAIILELQAKGRQRAEDLVRLSGADFAAQNFDAQYQG